MKKSLTQALGFCAAFVLLVSSCKKDEVKTVIQPSAAPTLTTSANNVVLVQPNAANNAVTYTWTPVTFGYQAIVTYTLQFDKKGGDFSAPISFDAGSSLTKTLSVSDLNSVYQSKGLVGTGTTQAATQADVRVVASVGAFAPTVASAITTVTATPYAFCEQPAASQAWTIIGPAGKDWDTDIKLTYDCVAKTYSYTGPLNAAAFKFRYGGQWKDNLDLGGAWSSTGGTLSQGASDITVPVAKIYTVTLNPGTVNTTAKTITGASYTVK
ncbi:MAG: SusE domain-containing protein [Janthinobacterium lividum]